MLSHEMEDSIRFGESLVGTAGAFERGCILFRVFCGNMYSERLCMEKLLLTRWTTEGEMPLVFFHVIVHSILILFHLRTDCTDKLAGSILLIDVRHVYRSLWRTALQFFCGAGGPITSASHNDYYDRHNSRPL